MKLAGLILFAVSTKLLGQTSDSQLKAKIDSIIQLEMTRSKAAGVAIGIVRDGRVFYNQGYGVKKIRTNDRVDSLTNFHLASISKVFVATGVMQLVEQGKINLDAKLLDYVPVRTLRDKRYKDITIRQMLMHTSGIPDVWDYHWRNPRNDSLALGRFAIKSIEHKKLKFDPGTNFRYSNRAFEILGHVIEAVSHQPFDAYEYDHVITQAGLLHSNFDYYKIDPPRRSTPHIKRFGKVKASKIYPYNREHGPSSTLNSCTSDMCQWMLEMQKIYDDNRSAYSGVLTHNTLMDMWTAKRGVFPNVDIGLTWWLFHAPLGLGAAHNGSDRGYGSCMIIFPEKKIGVILLFNGDYADNLYELAQPIAWMVADSAVKKVDVSLDYLKMLEGAYVTTDNPKEKRKITFKLENGELRGKDDGYHYRIIPIGDGKFINPQDGASLEFDTKNPNAITLLLFGNIRLKKVK